MLGLGSSLVYPDSSATGETLIQEGKAYSLYLSGPNDRMQGARITTSFQDWTANQDWTLRFQIELDNISNQSIAVVGPTTDYIWLNVTGGRLQLAAAASSATTANPIFNTTLTANTWTEIVLTCDSTSGANKNFRCYQDGNEVTKHSETVTMTVGDSLLPGTGKVAWGTFFNLVDYDFKLDNIASFDKVLSDEEILEIYNSQPLLTRDYGAYRSRANLTSYYLLEEGSGTTAADSSENSSTTDYSLVNSPVWSTDVMFPA